MEPAAALARLRLADGYAEDALEVTDKAHQHCRGQGDLGGSGVRAADVAPARVAALVAADRISEATALVGAFGRDLSLGSGRSSGS
jgi:hypothetical protein